MSERRFRRVPFIAAVDVSVNSCHWSGTLIDVALKGALVELEGEACIPLESRSHLSITLPGTTVSLDFEGILVHRAQNHYGFKFVSEDLVTLTHLRKLVELNTGDPEATQLELADWLQN